MGYSLDDIRSSEHLAEMLALAVEWTVNGADPTEVARRLVVDYTLPLDTAKEIANIATQFLSEQADIRE